MKSIKWHKKRSPLTLAVLLSLSLSLVMIYQATAANQQLTIIGGPISVRPDNANATFMSTTVIIRNNSEEVPLLRFSAISDQGDNIPVNVAGGASGISAYSIAQFTLSFPDIVSQKIDGFLIIEAYGIEPISEKLTLEPVPKTLQDQILGIFVPDITWIIQWSFTIGFVAVFIASLVGIWIKYPKKKRGLKQVFSSRMKGLKWKFEENWASTFVAVGGLLNVVASSKIMPENPIIFGKNGFQTLNTLFPMLIVLAPFLLTALNSIGPEPLTKDGTPMLEEDGKTPLLILPFVVGSSVVAWAVTGELFTLAVLFQELYVGDYISITIAIIVQVLLVILVAIGIYYVWKKIIETSLSAKELKDLQTLVDDSGILRITTEAGVQERPVYLP